MTNPRDRLLLRESSQPQLVTLSGGAAAEIARLGIATVTPVGNDEWLISGVNKVGVARVGQTEIRIEPKVPLSQLFFLLSRTLGWDAWRDEDVQLDSMDQFYPAITELFTRSAERVMAGGLLRTYQERLAAEPFIRGRWLVSEQIRKRHGLPLPAELSYDEFTVDVIENQMVRSAAERLLRIRELKPAMRRRLNAIDAQLSEATPLTTGAAIPSVTFNRRNQRYRTSLGLARLILEDASLDRGIAEITASGFLLTMSTLFERFIEMEVGRAAQPYGGVIVPQKRDYLDTTAQIVVKPDLVWLHGGVVTAVFDAKYKAEKPAGYPNADIYQMLAYCTRHQVPEGHLLYAAGSELPRELRIEEAGITIICHAIALDVEPRQILLQIDEIVGRASRTVVRQLCCTDR